MRRVLLLVILAAFIGDRPALPSTLVEFPNLPGREPARLIGYLARPDAGLSALIRTTPTGAAPYPAVVALHGCGGISSHSAAIADRLGAWGYVALSIDTLGPPGMEGGCRSGTFLDQAFDAYAALRYLSSLQVVDARRVALFGQSMGGSATLYAVDGDLAAQYFDQRFRAAIAYYPRCAAVPGVPTMTAPVLVLIGEADQWNEADACKALRNRARADSASIDLTVYPGVHHLLVKRQHARWQPGFAVDRKSDCRQRVVLIGRGCSGGRKRDPDRFHAALQGVRGRGAEPCAADSRYLGDARLAAFPPSERRMLSYASF